MEAQGRSLPCATLVVDSGFSFTHAVPIFDNTCINFGVRRMDVGGKLLTNHLKQVLSLRQWNVMDESYMINDVKEKACFVSDDLWADLAAASAKTSTKGHLLRKEYVMPDYISVLHGYLRDPVPPVPKGQAGSGDAMATSRPDSGARPADEQVLSLCVERFATPEVLFNPSDIGIEQAGVAETIAQAVSATIPDMHPALYANVLLTGGNTLFPNFQQRLERELRPLVPADVTLSVRSAPDPIVAAWTGASKFAAASDFPRYAVTKAEYLEHGHDFVRRACHN